MNYPKAYTRMLSDVLCVVHLNGETLPFTIEKASETAYAIRILKTILETIRDTERDVYALKDALEKALADKGVTFGVDAESFKEEHNQVIEIHVDDTQAVYPCAVDFSVGEWFDTAMWLSVLADNNIDAQIMDLPSSESFDFEWIEGKDLDAFMDFVTRTIEAGHLTVRQRGNMVFQFH